MGIATMARAAIILIIVATGGLREVCDVRAGNPGYILSTFRFMLTQCMLMGLRQWESEKVFVFNGHKLVLCWQKIILLFHF